MERYVVAARLKEGARHAAEELLAAGPPFDPGDAGLTAHTAFLYDDLVLLVFEGEAAHAKALRLANEHMVATSRWENIVSGLPFTVDEIPTAARCLYRWRAESTQ